MSKICMILLIFSGFSLYAATISGKVVDQNGKPLDSVVVCLRPENFIADTALSHNKTMDTLADSNGFYKFNNVDPGIYTIEASCKNLLGAIYGFRVSQGDITIFLPTLNLDVLSFVRGQVKLLPYQDTAIKVFIASPGLDHITRASSDGNFLMGLPNGYINLAIFTSSTVFSRYNSQIHLIPGDILNIGIITLEKNAPIAYKFASRHPNNYCNDYRYFDVRGREIALKNIHRFIPSVLKNAKLNNGRINIFGQGKIL